MKIAITSTGAGLEDRAHDMFGRCDYFVIVDSETGEKEALRNEFAASATAAGTACAQVIFDADAKVVISGRVGPNAYEALSEAGIEIRLCPPGITVGEALMKYKEGSLRKMEIKTF